MRFSHLIATALMASVVCTATMLDAANAADAKGRENICRSFVQTFYKWYLINPQSDRAYKQRASAFSPELLKQLNDDLAASKKNKDEVVGLDFDPFLDTNAEPFAKYVATKVTKRGNNYLVQVDGEGGNRADHTRILPEVACKDGKCQFVNFHYAESKPPDDNLLSILKGLRDNRHKEGSK